MAVGSGEVLLVADARVVADHWVLVVVVHDGVFRFSTPSVREDLQRQQYTVVVDGIGE